VRQANLSSLQHCAGMQASSLDLLKLAVVVAAETIKGEASWFAQYLQQLPTMQYYRAYHLQYAGEAIMRDFGELPIIRLVQHMQHYNDDLERCFYDWRSHFEENGGPDGLLQMQWDDVELALMHCRTRRINLDRDGVVALVPGTDMFNTATAAAVNIDWSLGPSGDSVDVHSFGSVGLGTELCIEYCRLCDNSVLLLLWGIYMDANPNVLDPAADRSFCSTSPASVVGGTTEASALQDLVASTLDLNFGSHGVRCPELDALDGQAIQRQAPLRCALARLALEYCAKLWAEEPDMEVAADVFRDWKAGSPKDSFSGMTLQEATDAVYASAIRGVHTFLLQKG